MALYEGNWLKLTALAPVLGSTAGLADAAGATALSCSARDFDLHLWVDAVTRYTVDLRLTYVFTDATGPSPDPDLHLRLYLDARMVEVISWTAAPRHALLRQLSAHSARELDRRWARNIMLGKWLDYLADMGHGFRA